MKTQIAKCIKNFKCPDFELIKNKTYNVSARKNNKLILFHHSGWYALEDYDEYLTIQKEFTQERGLNTKGFNYG